MPDLLVDTIIWDDFDIQTGKTFIPEELVKSRSFVKLDSASAYIIFSAMEIK